MSRLSALLLAALLPSCVGTGGAAPGEISERRVRVVASTGMVADAATQVGGDRVEVEALMGPGIDPHLYKASERDVISLAAADLIVFNGLHLEAKMADVLEKIGDTRATAAVAETIPRSRLLSPEGFEGAYDPHVWFDVSLWREVVKGTRDALIDVDPEHADTYRENARAYDAELAELDGYVMEQAAMLPPERRVLITAHDAFTYFGRAYGFEVLALQGISTVAEAGAGDVRSLAETIAERDIPAIFVESSVSTRFVRALQEAVRSRGYEVEVGGELFSDALGNPGTPEGAYLGMVRHNVDTIVRALR